MKSITIRLPDQEHRLVEKVASLRGITPEALALDALRCTLDTDLEEHFDVLLDRGMERPEPVVAEALPA